MINKLKIVLLENKYPFFSDKELQLFLDENDNDVYTTASTLCYLKADGDNKVTVGPITIESAGAEFWINLAERYSKKATELANKNNSTTSSSGYINRLKRC